MDGRIDTECEERRNPFLSTIGGKELQIPGRGPNDSLKFGESQHHRTPNACNVADLVLRQAITEVNISFYTNNENQKGNTMQVVIRKYAGKDAAALIDLLEKRATEVQSLMRPVKGLVSYKAQAKANE